MTTNRINIGGRDALQPKQYNNENPQIDSKEKNFNRRTVLGTLSQNTGRVQPFRAAKQVKQFHYGVVLCFCAVLMLIFNFRMPQLKGFLTVK